ncbi:MAG: ACT domain-containing protein [Ekhidna sp.]
MSGEIDLKKLLKELNPRLNKGEYVFVSTNNIQNIPRAYTICEFREKEGVSIIIEKDLADKLNLSYTYIAHWITLEIHSSLHAVGLTATVAQALMKNGISCNVVAGYYHDHLFVEKPDSYRAVQVLNELSKN